MAESRTPRQLFDLLVELDIETETVTHPPVFTVEQAKELRGELPGHHSKNLFLRNKKSQMFLLVALEDRSIDLKDLGDRLGIGRLSFGSPARLMTYLGVIPGAVSPFAVVNDETNQVHVILDRGLLDGDRLNFHPLDNAQTSGIAASDLLRFLEATGHEPEIVDLS
jgi:Ala-tRNA(Pro) deacylase